MPPTRIERMTSAWLLIQVLRSTTELKGLDIAMLSMKMQQKQNLCTSLHFAVSYEDLEDTTHSREQDGTRNSILEWLVTGSNTQS